MGGLSNAFWLWLPVLIYKAVAGFFKTIWKFNLWILQTISGVPLFYCKPEYRVPGIFIGTLGLFFASNSLFMLMALGSASGNNATNIGSFFVIGIIGIGLLLSCRFLIRRGSV
jgi:hypothetical protein